MLHRQRDHPAQFPAVLGKETHLTVIVKTLELLKCHAHTKPCTRYLYLTGHRRAVHRQPQMQRFLSERYPEILKREGNTHIQ